MKEGGTGKTTNLLIKVKQILVDLLPNMRDENCIFINSPFKPDGSVNPNRVEIETDDGRVPLFELSLGYKTMLAWTVDLALKMFWSNPESDYPLQEPAVVIVDEISCTGGVFMAKQCGPCRSIH